MNQLGYLANLTTSWISSILRLGSGTRLRPASIQPAASLTLYEFEGCPFCRKVREALTDLAIDADVRPCPKGGRRFRPGVVAQGGKAQFPYLIDPNRNVTLYESNAIIRHLYQHYGGRPRPVLLMLGPLTDFMVQIAMIPRLGAGVSVKESATVGEPLDLHGFEASPGTRLVREQLCSLEIPYRMVQLQPGIQVPSLKDPNTGATESGARNVLDYLEKQYANPGAAPASD